jgi:hypothetical protein
MSVVSHHRVAIDRRRFLVSTVMPHASSLCVGLGLLPVMLVAGSVPAMALEQV